MVHSSKRKGGGDGDVGDVHVADGVVVGDGVDDYAVVGGGDDVNVAVVVGGGDDVGDGGVVVVDVDVVVVVPANCPDDILLADH